MGTYELRHRILELKGSTLVQPLWTGRGSWRNGDEEFLKKGLALVERHRLGKVLHLDRIPLLHSRVFKYHLHSGLLIRGIPALSQIHRRKLTNAQVKKIRKQWNGVTVGCPSLAKKYGVCKNTISRIVKGKRYR